MCPWEHCRTLYDGVPYCAMKCLSCGDMDSCWEHDHSANEEGHCDCEGEIDDD